MSQEAFHSIKSNMSFEMVIIVDLSKTHDKVRGNYLFFDAYPFHFSLHFIN